MDPAKLVERLRKIEAIFAGATTPGERAAAESARERIQARLAESVARDPPIEYRFSMEDMWSRRLFLALLRRYGIEPFRYRRQRRTTVMARVPVSFVEETLWPEFERLSEALRSYLSDVTDHVIREVLEVEVSEATVIAPERLSHE